MAKEKPNGQAETDRLNRRVAGSVSSEGYLGCVVAGSEPFDPLELSDRTRQIVCEGDSRKYSYDFSEKQDEACFRYQRFYRGISTGYVQGCNLRCVFCWADSGRDCPAEHGRFYSPEEAVDSLIANKQWNSERSCYLFSLSGGEPTLHMGHLTRVLRCLRESVGSEGRFVLETNGILLGAHPEHVDLLTEFRGLVEVRVSLKAGTADGFQRRTGAAGEFFTLPFKAIESLRRLRISHSVAAMTDSALMPWGERQELDRLLRSLGRYDVEHEAFRVQNMNVASRMRKAGYHTT